MTQFEKVFKYVCRDTLFAYGGGGGGLLMIK